jgi:galactokinase
MHAVQSRAPGRVNIIGEHTDYNDGFVLPCAIASDTRVFASARPDSMVTVRSRFDEPVVFDLQRVPSVRRGNWTDYVRGMLIALMDAGVNLRGADMKVAGSVPLGAGLSSSASFEIALGLALLALSDAQFDRLRLARLAQEAECDHVGTRCGIMDQFAVLFARAGSALFLDTRSLDFRLIPVPPGLAVIVCNTMVKHDLAASAYNERRSECERSVQVLKSRFRHVSALRDVSMQQLEQVRSLLPAPAFARARHVISENARAVEAARALEAGDAHALGELMYASHESLRVDYEVSCAELDTMVELAKAFGGTIGARMTGGGFGGCTVNIVREEAAGDFRSYMATAYRAETGIVPELYDGTPSAGASVCDE